MLWIIPLALFNFITFVSIAMALGGDACNGMQRDGRYYLADHGRLTEVSAGIYVYSLYHTTSVFFTHSAAIIAFYLWIRSSRRTVT